MARKKIIDTIKYTVFHHTGITRFGGCQCFKDCTCNEDFIPAYYDIYSVRKKFNKYKTTHHNNIYDMLDRVEFLQTLPINKILADY